MPTQEAGGKSKNRVDTMSDSVIILFTRFPRAGQVKTRLIPHLGADSAMLLHKEMTEFTIKQAIASRIPLQIHFTDGTKEEMREWLCDIFCEKNSYANVELIPQSEGDLGQRMESAFNYALTHILKHTQNKNIKKVLIIGSDCPDNRTENMVNALRILDNSPCVIGPSLDGGYYLLGLRAENLHGLQHYSKLFHNMEWGTDTVLECTKNRAKEYTLLPILSDVDYPADIPKKISVIIPALNEEKNLKNCLKSLSQAFNIEIIVSDGASTDETCKIAREFGAIVCVGISQDNKPNATQDINPEVAQDAVSAQNVVPVVGRAVQIARGAKAASGEILFFLHADSLVPPLWDKQIREVMQDKQNSLGHFRFAVQENFWGKNLLTWGTNLRAKFLHLPYGDQGLFVRKKDFEGWDLEITPILEDVFLVKKASQNGKIVCINDKLYTSGRRWIKYGFIRITWINQGVLLAAMLGADLATLREAYSQGKNPLIPFIKNYIQKRFNI